MPGAEVNQETALYATVIRADGTIEELGLIAGTHPTEEQLAEGRRRGREIGTLTFDDGDAA